MSKTILFSSGFYQITESKPFFFSWTFVLGYPGTPKHRFSRGKQQLGVVRFMWELIMQGAGSDHGDSDSFFLTGAQTVSKFPLDQGLCCEDHWCQSPVSCWPSDSAGSSSVDAPVTVRILSIHGFWCPQRRAVWWFTLSHHWFANPATLWSWLYFFLLAVILKYGGKLHIA